MAQEMDNTGNVAVVIGSGSVKCAAALGMVRVLRREGIDINMVVGCSAGSMYAAFIALGYEVDTALEMTLQLWTRDLTKQRDRRALLRAIFPRWLGFDERFGIVDDRLIIERLRAAYGEKTFDDATIPLYMTATDFYTGEQVVLQEGRLIDAIRASISIPFTFKPAQVNGQLLVDGFMSDPLPISVAIREGADVILAMGFESPYQSRYTSVGRFAFQMSSIMTNNLLKARFAFHNIAHHSEVIGVLPHFTKRIRLFDTEKIPYIVEEGEKAMEKELPYLLQLLENIEH